VPKEEVPLLPKELRRPPEPKDPPYPDEEPLPKEPVLRRAELLKPELPLPKEPVGPEGVPAPKVRRLPLNEPVEPVDPVEPKVDRPVERPKEPDPPL